MKQEQKGGASMPQNTPVIQNRKAYHEFFVLENIEPDYNDTIEVLLDRPMFDFSMFRPLPRSFDYWRNIFRPNQLWYLTREQLRILRNLFYALHGYNFRDTALLNYFSSAFGSYEINRDFNENMITETERRNIEIIQREELRRTR